MLRLSGIKKRFGPTVALDGVDLELSPGDVHALIGENGAGKSTLMNIVAGAARADQGSMELDGLPFTPASPADARRRGIAFIHQELALCPHLSVAENILMGIEPSRFGLLDRRACQRIAQDVLETFHHPEIKPERRVADLPLAARQVVEICRAVAADARIILMDEPTSSLHREDVERLFALIRKLSGQGIGIIYISHFLEEVRGIARRFTVLRDGRGVDAGLIEAVPDQQLIAAMVGRAIETLFPRRERRLAGEPLLAVRDLAAPPALKQASFELRAGEIFGIAGLMGSGRTELVRALFGLGPARSGSCELKGKAIAVRGIEPSLRLGQRFGYLSEDRTGEGIAPALPIGDNITLTRLASCSRAGWLSLARQADQAARWIEQLSIRARTPAQRVSELSGGNQQKVAVARLLHQDAEILLLDEPTRGIDIGSKAKVYEIVSRCADQGKAVLLVSSYLPELFGLCDRLSVMSRGRLSEARPIAGWTPESVMRVAVGG